MTDQNAQYTTRCEPVVAIENLQFKWQSTSLFSLNIPNFRIYRGESILLLCPSGCGKSTLLNMICGLVTPQLGSIHILGENIKSMFPHQRDRFRADHIGVIFQMFNLISFSTAIDNVILPLSFSPRRRERVLGTDIEEAKRLLTSLGVDDNLFRTQTSKLSVGQQQRVAAARALIGEPEIIVADEPTSALDSSRRDEFLSLLFNQASRANTTIIMVSHDETNQHCFDRVLKMEELLEKENQS